MHTYYVSGNDVGPGKQHVSCMWLSVVVEICPRNYVNINKGNKKYLLDSADWWQVSKDCSHFADKAEVGDSLRQADGAPEKEADVLG